MNNLRATYSSTRSRLAAHKLFILIFGAVALSLLFVAISLTIYARSDAARLDLSHPDYKPLRSQITVDRWQGYSATGPIDTSSLDEFQEKYSERADRATGVNAFGGDVLSDQALGIE